MTVRNHLLATEHVVVRGLVSPLVGRLADHLRTCRRSFVTVTNAEVRTLITDHVTTADLVRVGIDTIVWAHEFVALSGDDFRRRHHEVDAEHPVILTMDRPDGLTLSGWQPDITATQDLDFFVVKKPRAEGATPLAMRHAQIIEPLPYVLVNHRAPAVIVPGQEARHG
jgi:hypothetical protein